MKIIAPENAIIAKIRSMFGRTITSNDYSDLIRKTSVSEIASYLKHNTSYSDSLSSISETQVHRGQIESLLHHDVFNKYIKFGRFVDISKNSFYHYIVLNIEIEQILVFLRYLNSGKPHHYIVTLPSFVTSHASIDLYSFVNVKNYSEFLSTLENTPYYKILKNVAPKDNELADISLCETELKSYYFNQVFKLIDKWFKGDERQELYNIFEFYAEMINIEIIFRLKKFFSMKPEDIKRNLLPFRANLSNKILSELIAADDITIAEKILSTTVYNKNLNIATFNTIEDFVNHSFLSKIKRYIHFSTSPAVVFSAYLFYCEIEIHNIICIIEGVRYDLPSSEIENLLIS